MRTGQHLLLMNTLASLLTRFILFSTCPCCKQVPTSLASACRAQCPPQQLSRAGWTWTGWQSWDTPAGAQPLLLPSLRTEVGFRTLGLSVLATSWRRLS
jgi:hypothetical protein